MEARKAKQTRSKNDGRDGTVFLGGDILSNIFLRLPPLYLFRSMLVSKSWLQPTTEPSFRLAYRSRKPIPRRIMLGFFYNLPSHRLPEFVPTDQSDAATDLIGHGDLYFEMLEPASNSPVLQVVDSCNGSLLLYSFSEKSYYVWNPVVLSMYDVPLLPEQESHAIFYVGFSCEPSPPSGLFSFKVVRAVAMTPRVQIETFSSDTCAWVTTESSNEISIRRPFSSAPSVLLDGTLYWLHRDRQILAYDEKRSHFSLIKLPSDVVPSFPRNACLGDLEGLLCYACVEESFLYVWLLRDPFHSAWNLVHRIGLRGFRELCDSDVWPMTFLGGDSQIMFLGMMKKVFSFHLETRELKELCNNQNGYIRALFPYEVPDASLFLPITGKVVRP